MESGMRASLRRVVALALGALVTGAGTVLSGPVATAASDQLTVNITSVSVTGTTPEAIVHLQATVTNTSATPVYGARVAMWRSRDPITDLSALRQAIGTNPPSGFTLLGDAGRQKITDDAVPFQPGSTSTVSVSATLAQLGFDTAGAAYTVGIRALGLDRASGTYPEAGIGRTVIALPATSVPVTRLVVLTAAPTKLTSNVFRNDDLVAQLTGRLDSLLTAAAAPGASWLLDPALLDEVTDMANGYQVRREGDLVAGAGQPVAAAWLARFQQLNRANGARSLFANPDIAGAAAARDPQVLSRAQTAAAAVSAVSDLPLVVLPTDAVHTTELDGYLTGSGARAVVATNVASAGAWQPSSGLPVLAATDESGGIELSDLQRNQILQAEAVIAGPAGQLRLIRDPSDLAADQASTATWMVPRGLSELLRQAPTGAEAELLPAAVPILEKGQFEEIGALERDFAAYGQLVPAATVTDEAAALLTRAASAAWIGDPRGYHGLLGAIDELVGPQALARAVTLDASSRFLMSSRTNEFPVTLKNNLDETIQLKVVVDSDNPQRVRVPETGLIRIAPGQSETVNVRPEASGNGVVPVRAFAATESGRRLTPPTRITIEITELGYIGWLIVLGSGGVLVLATTLRILQVRRKSSTAGPEARNG